MAPSTDGKRWVSRPIVTLFEHLIERLRICGLDGLDHPRAVVSTGSTTRVCGLDRLDHPRAVVSTGSTTRICGLDRLDHPEQARPPGTGSTTRTARSAVLEQPQEVLAVPGLAEPLPAFPKLVV